MKSIMHRHTTGLHSKLLFSHIFPWPHIVVRIAIGEPDAADLVDPRVCIHLRATNAGST